MTVDNESLSPTVKCNWLCQLNLFKVESMYQLIKENSILSELFLLLFISTWLILASHKFLMENLI
mgnify:CR=1 FL=1